MIYLVAVNVARVSARDHERPRTLIQDLHSLHLGDGLSFPSVSARGLRTTLHSRHRSQSIQPCVCTVQMMSASLSSTCWRSSLPRTALSSRTWQLGSCQVSKDRGLSFCALNGRITCGGLHISHFPSCLRPQPQDQRLSAAPPFEMILSFPGSQDQYGWPTLYTYTVYRM